MLRRLAFVALALIVAPSSVMAASVEVGGVSITLPTPTGFCEFSESNASDRRMLTTLRDILSKTGNKLLGMSADCRQLADWRGAKRQLLDDYGQFQTTLGQMEASSGPPEPIKQTCATLRAEGDKILSNQFPEIKSRVESALEKVKMNEAVFIGVLAEDPTACYAGLIQKIHTEANTDKVQVTLFAVTTIKGKFLALGSKVAARLVGVRTAAEAQEIVHADVVEILQELSETRVITAKGGKRANGNSSGKGQHADDERSIDA